MDKIVIRGGQRLCGEVTVAGAKNSALPLMFASLLTQQPCRLHGVPDVADIHTARRLLVTLGAEVSELVDGEIEINCAKVDCWDAPYDLVRKMRASFLVLGPLLARLGRARVSQPGGCAIGTRPVDIHIAGIQRLGAKVDQRGGYVEVRSDRLEGGHVIFDSPSVGATENVLMAAALAHGSTRMENAAREPEIVDLADALRSMGANISGDGSSIIEIEGVERLGAMDHTVIPDRIAAGTYLIAAVMTRGEVLVRGARAADLGTLLEILEACGAALEIDGDAVRASVECRPRPIELRTAPYPGFPTDLQAQVMAMASIASGTSRISETIVENRCMHVPELVRMGADITVSGGHAEIVGQVRLSGAPVMATDLRASVSLVLAGLAAERETEVLRVYHLDRGYERIEHKLRELGALIDRVPVGEG